MVFKLLNAQDCGAIKSHPSKEQNMAYLDPGSGSFILQLLIAAILGGLVALRAYWGRLISFFRRDSSQDDPEEENE